MSPKPFLLAALCAVAVPALAQTPAPAAPPAATAPAPAPDPEAVVARVDGDPITEADLAVAAEDPALTLQGVEPAQKRSILIGYVIDLKLGAKAAEKLKLEATPSFKRHLAYLRDKLLVDDYLEAQTKDAVTDAAAHKLYDETVKGMKPEEEVRARHILVPDEAAAKDVEARLKKGEDFATVAAAVSTDPGTKQEGGELGFFTKDRMVKPFADAAFAQKVGETSAPVQSQFGWHVIQTEEKRTKPVPTFAEMRDQIDQYLTRKAQQDAVTSLRQTGKVERTDVPVAPAPAGAPATAPAK